MCVSYFQTYNLQSLPIENLIVKMFLFLFCYVLFCLIRQFEFIGGQNKLWIQGTMKLKHVYFQVINKKMYTHTHIYTNINIINDLKCKIPNNMQAISNHAGLKFMHYNITIIDTYMEMVQVSI